MRDSLNPPFRFLVKVTVLAPFGKGGWGIYLLALTTFRLSRITLLYKNFRALSPRGRGEAKI
jgi:hypothetical protein